MVEERKDKGIVKKKREVYMEKIQINRYNVFIVSGHSKSVIVMGGKKKKRKKTQREKRTVYGTELK